MSTIRDLFAAPDASPRHQGKTGTAPCGHQGEHLSANYIYCSRCDCTHNTTYDYNGYIWCKACGKCLTVAE